MSEKCEQAEKCPFFKNFGEYKDIITSTWVKIFCCDTEKAVNCKSLEFLRHNNGMLPPDNMSPTGKMI